MEFKIALNISEVEFTPLPSTLLFTYFDEVERLKMDFAEKQLQLQ